MESERAAHEFWVSNPVTTELDMTTERKQLLSIGNQITIWIFIAGLVVAGLARGVDLEKQAVAADTRQKQIIQTQQEIKKDLKEAREKQEKAYQILIELRSKQQ